MKKIIFVFIFTITAIGARVNFIEYGESKKKKAWILALIFDAISLVLALDYL